MTDNKWIPLVNLRDFNYHSSKCDTCSIEYNRMYHADFVIDHGQCINCVKPTIPLSPNDLVQLAIASKAPQSLHHQYGKYLPGLIKVDKGSCMTDLSNPGSYKMAYFYTMCENPTDGARLAISEGGYISIEHICQSCYIRVVNI